MVVHQAVGVSLDTEPLMDVAEAMTELDAIVVGEETSPRSIPRFIT